MLIQFLPPSPKAGRQEHVAREIGEALIVAGFALDPHSIEPAAPQRPQFPPEGWSIVKAGPFGEHVTMRRDDGQGGFQLFDKLPAPVRTWIPPRGDEADGHYEMRPPIVIPDSVLEAWRLAGGGVANDEDARQARSEAKRDRLNQQQFAQDKQNAGANTFMARVRAGL